MHPISDKELDKLFRDQFQEAEFQPSDAVWTKIASEMDGRKPAKKKGYPVSLMAAASVILVLAAGLWFYRSPDVIRLQGAPGQITENKKEVKPAGPAPVVPEENNGAAVPGLRPLSAAKEQLVYIPENIQAGENIPPDPGEAPADTRVAENRQRIPADLPVKAVVTPSAANDAGQPGITEPAVPVNTLAFAETDPADDQDVPARKKITSIGDLVNFVVSRVDHREDKIIEFIDGEEGSEVSGINLGLVKFKSRIK